jgi:hypothetical protein
MSGAPVDIISGMPLDPGFGRSGRAAAADDLIAQMQMASLPQSESARAVADKILQVLEERIAQVLSEDPQARTCLEIMRAINAPAITARESARRYIRRFNPITPALGTETTPEKDR